MVSRKQRERKWNSLSIRYNIQRQTIIGLLLLERPHFLITHFVMNSAIGYSIDEMNSLMINSFQFGTKPFTLKTGAILYPTHKILDSVIH
jgi:hypothetical protein